MVSITEKFFVLNWIFLFILFLIFIISFLGLTGKIIGQVKDLPSGFGLSKEDLVSTFQLQLIFLILLLLLNFNFLPWGLNLLLNFNNIFFLRIILFIRINLLNLRKRNHQLHLVGPSEGVLMRFFFYFIHLLGDLIKPLSLSLRLFINLTFGHILIITICSFIRRSLFLSPFLIYELFVFLVQRFIFATLTKIYLN